MPCTFPGFPKGLQPLGTQTLPARSSVLYLCVGKGLRVSARLWCLPSRRKGIPFPTHRTSRLTLARSGAAEQQAKCASELCLLLLRQIKRFDRVHDLVKENFPRDLPLGRMGIKLNIAHHAFQKLARQLLRLLQVVLTARAQIAEDELERVFDGCGIPCMWRLLECL